MKTYTDKEALELLEEALALPEESRRAHVESRCIGRDQLRARVERLLSASTEASDLPVLQIELHGKEALQPAVAELPAGHFPTLETHGEGAASIGPYLLLGVLGEGGMGIVYRARQASPRRVVALKVLRPDFLHARGFLRRFQREVELLGRLTHPGIARIYDAGGTKLDGEHLPYIAMEYVDGETLSAHVERRRPRLADKLELLARIADAVQAAHQKAIVHRDLKPSNILVTADGMPKILDFGIATSTEVDVDETQRTQVGDLLGTFAYMSPEQARCDAEQIDGRSDLYTLGLIGYELLAGQPAFEYSGNAIDWLRRTEFVEPTPLGRIDRDLRGDLEAIFAKACRYEPAARYESAAAFGADLRRFLDRRPISARPLSPLYELDRFVRRNRGLVGALALAVLAILVGAIGSGLGFLRATRGERLAEERAGDLERIIDFQAERLSGIDFGTIGAALRRGLVAEVQAASDLDAPASLRGARAAQLESLIAGIDFTGLALATLEEPIFGPTLEGIEREFDDRPLVQADMLQSLARILRRVGLLEAALAPQEQALQLRRERLGEEDRALLESQLETGTLALARGEREAAAQIFEEGARIAAGALGATDSLALEFSAQLAGSLKDSGELEAAERLARSVLQSRQELLGPEHLDTLASMDSVAMIVYARGDYEAALELGSLALEGRRRVSGEEDSRTLASMNSLAWTLRALGRLEETRELHSYLLEVNRRRLGEEHPSTLMSMSNLGLTLQSLGELDGAFEYGRRALSARRRILGVEHPATLLSMNALALTLKARGDLVEACRLEEELLAIHLRTLGERHSVTLNTMSNLSNTLKKRGELLASLEHGERTLALRREVLGEEHPDTLTSLNNLGYLFLALAQPQRALELGQLAHAGRRQHFGDEHHLTLSALRLQAGALRELGQLETARELGVRVLDGRRAIFKPEAPRVLTSMHELAKTLLRLGELDEARALAEPALRMREQGLGEDHPDTIRSLLLSATIELGAGEAASALPVARRALELARGVAGSQGLLTLEGMEVVARVLHASGAGAEAGEMTATALEAVRTRADANAPVHASLRRLADELGLPR